MNTLTDSYACNRKRRHPDKQAAEQEALRMERLEREPFTIYACIVCGGFHVAHKEKKRA